MSAARGEASFDSVENPTFMDQLFSTVGAHVVPYPAKVRCCGGMLMYTFEPVALDMVGELLVHAHENGANAIATTCPMCHANLELHQKKLQRLGRVTSKVPVYFFTQLIGLAMGFSPQQLEFDHHAIATDGLVDKLVASIEEKHHV